MGSGYFLSPVRLGLQNFGYAWSKAGFAGIKLVFLVHSGAAGSETELNQKQVVSTTYRTTQRTTQKDLCLFYQEVMMIINITGNLKSGINNREWWSWVRSWMLGCLQQSLAPRYGKLGQAVNCCGVSWFSEVFWIFRSFQQEVSWWYSITCMVFQLSQISRNLEKEEYTLMLNVWTKAQCWHSVNSWAMKL